MLVAIYPAIWGLCQLVTGGLSDHWGRKHLITAEMLIQATALGAIAALDTFGALAAAAAALGVVTALVYPTLLAVIGDVAHPAWRARAVGVYRLWRDLGFAVGALLSGLLADAWGLRPTVWCVAVITADSGLTGGSADVRDPPEVRAPLILTEQNASHGIEGAVAEALDYGLSRPSTGRLASTVAPPVSSGPSVVLEVVDVHGDEERA
ncbi:MFS transporter [Nocardioides sp.]|uniref:MFS transporter n=1 Tax=Nocardioides sp. TaxID=35761 RepID=UPI00260A55BA|nr:MFS transporter [Nocardioides sp.]